jgi:hypothetical protein
MTNLVERWIIKSQTQEEAIKIAIHETLREVVNNKLDITNTAFTEALFDALCGRQETGLWFAEECFNKIKRVVKE